MPARIEKPAVVVLAMQLHKAIRQGPQDLARDAPVVDPGGLAPVSGVDPPQDQLALLGLNSGLGQNLVHGMIRRESKHRRDLALLGPGTNQLGPPAPAKDKAQSFKKDGFPGAGLAGQHVEARLKLQSQPIDDQHIADVETPEHGSPPGRRGACLHHSHSPLTICR